MSEERRQISITEVIVDLSNGLTRKIGDNGYDPEVGSIQEKYDLSKAKIDRMFKHPKLKGRKVRFNKDDGYDLIDDLGDNDIQVANYGDRSAASVERNKAAQTDLEDLIIDANNEHNAEMPNEEEDVEDVTEEDLFAIPE